MVRCNEIACSKIRTWNQIGVFVCMCMNAWMLQIDDDKRKDSTFFSHKGRYDKKVPTFQLQSIFSHKKNKKKEMIMNVHSVFESVLFLCILQPVILKELKQADGDFTEDQRIELNTVRHLCVMPQTSYKLIWTLILWTLSTLLYNLLWVPLNHPFLFVARGSRNVIEKFGFIFKRSLF